MENIILENLYLIILLPLWIFLLTMTGRFFSVYINKVVIHILTLFASFWGAASCGVSLYLIKPDIIYNTQYSFIKINNFVINCGLHVDRLALIFGLILYLVSFFVQLFSISYMKDEKKQYRFYALMNLFNFAVAGLFFSPNLFQTYVFWEIAGIVSYLLIGFEYFKEEKSLASKKVLIINRIGDTAFIGGIILCSYLMYQYAPSKTLTSLAFTDLNIISTLTAAYTSEPLFNLICILFITAAVVKSAQTPFYTWLQDAMEAKLPVSALLHSSTLVALGLFLTIRMLPFYTITLPPVKLIGILGLFTALVCSLSACAQTHPKRVLAYSTSAQFGLMFFAISILNIKAAVGLFCAHALIKSLMFITLPDDNKKWNYIHFIIFLVSGLSLSGLIFSGMIAKEMLAFGLNNIYTAILSVLAFLTAFYVIRIALITADKNCIEKIKPKFLEVTAEAGLLLLNVVFYFYLRKLGSYQVAETFWGALTAWIVVYILYVKNAFWKVPLLYPLCFEGFYLDKLYTTIITNIYNSFSNFLSKFDVNIFGNYKWILSTSSFGVKTFWFIEKNIMNKTVKLVSKISEYFSKSWKKCQTGKIQRYNLYAFIIITIILTILIIAYTVILSWLQEG